MSQSYVSIVIEGDFIDSYIYSGTLFLVHADSKVTTHSWEKLLGFFLRPTLFNRTFEFLKDCRKAGLLKNREPQTITIDKANLDAALISTLPLRGWPTDINIFNNRFYIAGEDGVEEIKYDHLSRTLKRQERFRVWDKYAYKVSANDASRLAIAAGLNGVITALPRVGYIKNEDISTLLEINSIDCEWVGSRLIANSKEGAYLSTFSTLPKKPEEKVTPAGYWEVYNAIRRRPPQTKKVSLSNSEIPAYAWITGRKLFSISTSGQLAVSLFDDGEEQANAGKLEIELDISDDIQRRVSEKTTVFSARSGSFGTVIEIGDELFVITEDGTTKISSRPVTWRVFPRARNYLNHLHIVENDRLSILAYIPPLHPNALNRYGIDEDEDEAF